MSQGFDIHKSNDIIELQQTLISLGYDLGDTGKSGDGVDGKWGPKTQGAVKNFQKAHGLKVDGIPGIMTLSVMEFEISAQHNSWERAVQAVMPNALVNDVNEMIPSGGEHDMKYGTVDASGTRIITYTMDSTIGNRPPSVAVNEKNRVAFNDWQKATTRDVLKEYERVINVKFVEVPNGEPGKVDLTICAADLKGKNLVDGKDFGLGGYASSEEFKDNKHVFSRHRHITLGAEDSKPQSETWFRGAILHEVGHTLGASHPHDHYDKKLGRRYENGDLTVMSYTGQKDELGPVDVAALREIYGANPNYNAGNTVYVIDESARQTTIFGSGTGEFNAVIAPFAEGPSSFDMRDAPDATTYIGKTDKPVKFAKGAAFKYAGGNDKIDDYFNVGSGEHWVRGGSRDSDTFAISQGNSVTHIVDYRNNPKQGERDILFMAPDDSTMKAAPIHVQATPEGAYVRTVYGKNKSAEAPVEVIVTFNEAGSDRNTSMQGLVDQLKHDHPTQQIVVDMEPKPLAERRTEFLHEIIQNKPAAVQETLRKVIAGEDVLQSTKTGLLPVKEMPEFFDAFSAVAPNSPTKKDAQKMAKSR